MLPTPICDYGSGVDSSPGRTQAVVREVRGRAAGEDLGVEDDQLPAQHLRHSGQHLDVCNARVARAGMLLEGAEGDVCCMGHRPLDCCSSAVTNPAATSSARALQHPLKYHPRNKTQTK